MTTYKSNLTFLIQNKLITETGRIVNRPASYDNNPMLLQELVSRTSWLNDDVSTKERIWNLLVNVTETVQCVCCKSPAKFNLNGNHYYKVCDNPDCKYSARGQEGTQFQQKNKSSHDQSLLDQIIAELAAIKQSTQISCCICGNKFDTITRTHLLSHNMTVDEYKAKFPTAPLYSTETLSKMSESSITANESRIGICRSPEVVEKIKATKSTNPILAWNKGRTMTTEAKRHLSVLATERQSHPDFIHPNSGKLLDQQTKDQISESVKLHHSTLSADDKAQISSKRRQTLKQKTEAGWVRSESEILQKRQQTLIDRYGTANLNQIDSVVLKRNQTMLERYGVTNPAHIDGVQTKRNRLVVDRHNLVQAELEQLLSYQHHQSVAQKEIVEFIQQLDPNLDTQINNRSILSDNRELDIWIPSLNLAIEYNGIYWHGSGSKERDAIARARHIRKTDECNELGIQLIQIFENEWELSQDIVKSRLRGLVGKSCKIYARKCTIRQLSSVEAKTFFNETHLQGSANASKVYGLIFNNEIVAAMSFGRPRFTSKAEYELIRFSNKLNHTVVGGASKLLKHFIANHPASRILSYADRRWSNGKLYQTLGFKLSHVSAPSYYYFKLSEGLHLHNRLSFRKDKLATKLEHYDEMLTEYQNMYNHGYMRIWDCGNTVWIYE